MKIIRVLILTLFVIQMGFSQTEQLVYGKVLSNKNPIQGADVINYSTKINTITNSEGFFSINAKPNDILLFYHKNYVEKKIILTSEQFDNLDVELALKAIELDDVIVDKNPFSNIKITQTDIYYAKLKREQERPKPVGVYDGSMPYGMDIFGVVGIIYKAGKKLFGKGEKDIIEPKKQSKITFKQYVAANIQEDYFVKDLKLDPNEIERFITFCNSDPKSYNVLRDVNILKVREFLEEKNIDFRKLKRQK